MKYEKSNKYLTQDFMSKIMGPNPLKLIEELFQNCQIKHNGLVLDLGSGNGVSSAFIAKEYGYNVIAGDLWSDPTDNKQFFDKLNLSDRIMPLKIDAESIPFAKETFDGIACIDAYNFFGRSKNFFSEKILPYIKKGGYAYFAISGMKKDYHSNLPKELLVAWTSEQMEYMQDLTYWKDMIVGTENIQVISFKEMQTNEEAWKDWIQQTNEYAVGDKKAFEAGAINYLNFIEVIIKKL